MRGAVIVAGVGLALELGLGVLAGCSASSPVSPADKAAQTGDQEAPRQMNRLMTWDDLLGRPKPSPTETIKWGPGETDVADLWLPYSPGPHPVVLMVHGGCWQKAIADRTLMNYAADELRKQGIAVWNIEYRGVDEAGGGYPGTFLDVAYAADALRDNAAKYGLKVDRVAVFGHSAGGHLAMWLAARPKLPKASPMWMENPAKIAGVVNSGGLADLKASAPVTQASCLSSIMPQLVGEISSTRANVLSDTSPAEMLPLKVRQVAVNGDRDAIAPAVLGEDIVRRAKAAGDTAEVIVVAKTGHVELISPGTAAFDAEVKALKGILGAP